MAAGTLRAESCDLGGDDHPFALAQRRLLAVLAHVEVGDAQLAQFSRERRVGSADAEEHHQVGAQRHEPFEIDVAVESHVGGLPAGDAAAERFVDQVLRSGDAHHAVGHSEGVEHGDVGARHADHAPRLVAQHLPLETCGGRFAVAGDEEVLVGNLVAVPRVVDGDERAAASGSARDLESRGVAGRVDRQREVADRAGGALTAGGQQQAAEQGEEASHRLRVWNLGRMSRKIS